MTNVFVRSIRDVSKFTTLPPQTTPVTQRLSSYCDRSFRYHVPRRIRYFSGQTSSYTTYAPRSTISLPESRGRRGGLAQLLPQTRSGNPAAGNSGFAAHTAPLGLQLARTHPRTWSHESFPWVRGFHQSQRGRSKPEIRRERIDQQKLKNDTSKAEEITRDASKPESGQHHSQHEHFYDRIHMPQFHRPTKEELLAAATGFWSRLKVRFKWLTIKSTRPFNVDEIVGFISWIALGHVIWIVVGTTTFVSLAIFAINTVFAQETLAGWIGNYLTKSSGLHVVFESAIVPKWSDGVITFKNVFVSRRPGQRKSRVTKGSPEAAAQASSFEDPVSPEPQNYTQFDITLGEINVTLSFSKWWNSKGPLQNVEIKHIRGVVDRTHVFWTGEEMDPKTYRHEHNPGDFEIESFKIEDLLVTVLQPEGFRPFPVSIYNADLPRLRKQWLFYDFLCANSMTGEFDRSLFTIHPRQTHSFTGATLHEPNPTDPSNEPWKKQSRIRIDAMNIDHLNRGAMGPLSWIHEGNVDIVADVMIPNDCEESVMKVVTDFYERMEAALTSRKHLELPATASTTAAALRDDTSDAGTPETVTYGGVSVVDPASPAPKPVREEDKRFLVMDLRIHLNDVRAVVPLFTRDLSYINNALIRPIVAYINSRRTFIPINCRVVKRLSDFDGSWTVFDSGLMDDLSAEVYDAFASDVTDEQARLRRFKKVGLWSLQLAVQAIFLGMAGNIA
ncbi:Mitochondrial distribution and morphology protein 31, mitochondrial precursor [Exophiala xenobiotica]|nr:Mitochondrial distribution and morphology protein 31, mitochondrial precursor [Exophiala xenobiotica]KAK5203783.1 Mitochondrial distribution and morphology protein 31, mitochondrial precursor [Exophiala xenobiotica]KAK5216308.1 Mitochondrial distribution and morphology protein 31, mitochondrial precursor [Exophiala xenobiotica]KAK5224352.1 Mitochondrial distribution and morphology protein 31, mitochondrial precursor [Exophiala xenobiotica]KAK5247768.1 Mitochondrial distribution and morpholog